MADETTPFTQDDYEVVNREVPYEGVFRMARYHIRFRLYRGGFSETILREVMERHPAAGVLPYDPNTDQVVLIEQFRAGALSNPTSPWLLEIIAGSFNHNEKPKETAYREGQEEAGCEILDLYPICEYFVSPGACNEYFYLYCGRFDASTGGNGIYGLPEEHEDIRAFTISSEEAFTLLEEGKIKTSPAIIALQWLKLNRVWLKQLWQTK